MAKIYNRGLYIGGEKRKVGTYIVTVVDENATGILGAYGASVPVDADKGFAPGCLFWKSSGGSTGSTLYVNEGSKSSADFNAVGGGGGSLSNFSMDDAYNDGSVIAVDSGAVDFAGVHATNNTVIVRATGSGNAIDIVNSGTGKDIDGQGSTWSVTKTGAGTFVSLTVPAITSAANLALEATGAGTVTIAGSSTGAVSIAGGGGATTIGGTLTVTGGADADAFIITAGDVLMSDGHFSMIQPDNESSIGITAAGTTTANAISITANALTSGAGLYIASSNGASFSGAGGFINCYDGSNSVFSVGRYGALTIKGNAAGTNSIVLTAGDLTMTSGHLVMTSGNATMTVGDLLLSDGSVTIIDADNAASFAVTNSTASSASVCTITSASVATGTLMAFAHSVTPITSGGSVLRLTSTATNTSTTTGVLLDMADASVAGTKILGTFGTTTGIGMSLVTAVTSGTALSLTNGTGVLVTTGEMLLITANSATTCTGILRMSATSLTDGWMQELTLGGAALTASGGGINIAMGAATAGTGIKVVTTGDYTGTTGLLALTANTATSGVIAAISATSLTTGAALKITTNTTATGEYINCYDGAAVDFKVSRYGAVTIAGNAATDVFTITAGHAVLTSGNLTLTSGNVVLTSGNLTLTSGNFVHTSGTFTINAVELTATALEINRVADLSSRLVAAGGTETATVADHGDRIILWDTAAGSVVTLPAATGSGVKIKCVISAIATSNAHIVKVANGSDTIKGAIIIADQDSAGTVTAFVTASDSDTITLNRSTTGSVTVGEWVELIDIAANVWAVSGVLTNTGSGATPFSATV